MRYMRLWQAMLGLACTVIEAVDLDDTAGAVVVSVRPCWGACAAVWPVRAA